jgi:hypothetical protein
MTNSPSRPKRKADIVTRIAVALFVLVAAMELALASWLPQRLRTERLWGREMDLQNLIEQLDALRAHVRSQESTDRWQRGEIDLSLSCLDDIARHLRDHQSGMTRDQVHQLQEDLAFFDTSRALWKSKRRHFTVEELHSEAWLARQQERLAASTAETTP